MRYVFNTFTLNTDEIVFVTGLDSLFTYQNIGNNLGTVQGSNDSNSWINLQTLLPSETAVITHSYKFLKLVGNTVFSVNRGIVQNNTPSNDPSSLVNRYKGDWDLSQGTVELIQAVPDPSKSSGFVKLNDAQFEFIADTTPITMGVDFYDFVAANGASTVNNGIRWGTIYIPQFSPTDNAEGIFFGVTKNTQTMTDAINVNTNGSTPVPVSGVLFFLFNSTGLQLGAYVYNNATSLSSGLSLINTNEVSLASLPAGTPLHFGIDTSTGELYIQINSNPPILLSKTLSTIPFQTDTYSPFYSIAWNTTPSPSLAYPETFLFDLGATADGKLPFLSAVINSLTLPNNAKDGEVYKCINGTGTVLGEFIQSNDYVEFADSLTKLIITRRSLTQTQLQQACQTVITAEVQSNGIIKDAIIEEIENVNQTQVAQVINLINDYDLSPIDPTARTVIVKSSTLTTDCVLSLPSQQDVLSMSNGDTVTILFQTDALNLFITGGSGVPLTGLGTFNGIVAPGDCYQFVLIKSTNDGNYWVRTK